MAGSSDRWTSTLAAARRNTVALAVATLICIGSACSNGAENVAATSAAKEVSATTTSFKPAATESGGQTAPETASAIKKIRYEAEDSPMSFEYIDGPQWIIRDSSFASLRPLDDNTSDDSAAESPSTPVPVGISLHYGTEATTENQIFSIRADPPGEPVSIDGLVERWEQAATKPDGPVIDDVVVAGHPAVRAVFPPSEFRGELVTHVVTSPSRTYLVSIMQFEAGDATESPYRQALAILETLELE